MMYMLLVVKLVVLSLRECFVCVCEREREREREREGESPIFMWYLSHLAEGDTNLI